MRGVNRILTRFIFYKKRKNNVITWLVGEENEASCVVYLGIIRLPKLNKVDHPCSWNVYKLIFFHIFCQKKTYHQSSSVILHRFQDLADALFPTRLFKPEQIYRSLC